MGKKLDALLGRKFKTDKFKPQVNLTISRLGVLKKQRQVKCSQARSDVVQLLQQGYHERALLRVEHVIKEQNMLDAFVMMESYCNLMIERVHLFEQEKVCPDELKEAISTLLFAASRCGELPELQEIRALLVSRYGKEFVNRAIELRNNCGVNSRMIQKLSTRQPELENRIKLLKEIAAENGIVLQLEVPSSVSSEEIFDVDKKQKQDEINTSTGSAQIWPGDDDSQNFPKEMRKEDEFTDSMKARKKYKDVADAAQAAFESAAYAASAARAAVELSRSEFHDSDDNSSPNTRRRKATDKSMPMRFESETKIEDIHGGSQAGESKHSKSAAELERTVSSSSSDLTGDNVMVTSMSFDEVDHVKLLEKDIVLNDSDIEDSGFSQKQIYSSSQATLKVESAQPTAHVAEESGSRNKQLLNMVKGPVSVRTRRVRGY